MPVPGQNVFPGDDQGQGGRTLADLRAEVLGNDFSTETYAARVTNYLNEALRRVDRQIRLSNREGTQAYTTTTNTLSLPAFRVRIISLRNTADRTPLANVDIDQIDYAPDATGKPTAYALSGGQIVLYPTPDQAYSLELRYRATGGQFTSDTDTTGMVGFPDDYADILVSHARSRLYRAEDDAGMAQFWEAEFQRQLEEMRADLQYAAEDEVRQVPSMWEGYSTGPVFTWGT